MKIIKIISQHRRDFTAQIKCESCNNEETLNSGYDDTYYHNTVLPNIKCSKCQESTVSANKPIEPQTTKYPDGYQI